MDKPVDQDPPDDVNDERKRQRRLFDLDKPRARNTDPETSHAAARSVKNRRPLYDWILSRLIRYPEGLTDVRLAELHAADPLAPKTSASGLRTRRCELVDRLEVRESGRTVRLKSGRQAIVWILMPEER